MISRIKDFILHLLGKSQGKKYPIPNWMCVGVPKSGTTSLYNTLKEHPQIWMPKSKETQFFCSPDYEKGMEWYLEHFYLGADPDIAVGELSPKYLIHKDVPRRIKKVLNDEIKFLVILRHPVDRAWSHYCHSYKVFRTVHYRPTEDLDFEEAIEAEPQRLKMPDEYGWTHGMWNAYYYTGLYAKHLKNWFTVFDRKKFLIITLDDFIEKPRETIDKITDHLRISRFGDILEFKKSNSYSRPDGMTETTRKKLLKKYKPYNKELEELLGRKLDSWNK